MKQMVQALKQMKIQQQQQEMAQMRGQAQGVGQQQSPVTQKAFQILDETLQKQQ
jgi:hypothetical protein